MKRVLFLLLVLLCTAAALPAENPWSFKGTVVKMRMTECLVPAGFRATMSGLPPSAFTCPEYTVMSDRVVYVIVGRRTESFIPLAENMDFLIRKNEIILFSSDEKSASRFTIQQMMLRSEWEREQERKELEAKALERSVSYEVRNPPRVSVISTSAK
jgi:hypothetical protein